MLFVLKNMCIHKYKYFLSNILMFTLKMSSMHLVDKNEYKSYIINKQKSTKNTFIQVNQKKIL